MTRVQILVEGQTEETFVNEVLVPHFASKNIYLQAVLVVTKRVKDGPNIRGGIVSYGKVKFDIQKQLQNPTVAMVTTMFDFYGLPKDFPGMDNQPEGNCYARVQHLEGALEVDINHRRFLPFLMLHEYEALLFSDPMAAKSYLPSQEVAEFLVSIRDKYNSPEEINDGSTTHPSYRLMELITDYQKPIHGPLLAMEIGLDVIRSACPHFDQWLSKLENSELVE